MAPTTSNSHTNSKAKKSTWPEAALKETEKRFISISVGNTSIHWAFHGKPKDETLHPHYFWRTPHLNEEDVELDSVDEISNSNSINTGNTGNGSSSLIHILARYIPLQVSEYLFGKPSNTNQNHQTFKSANEQNEARGHLPSFYIVSTNDQQTNLLTKMIGSIPVRIYILQADDFFPQDNGSATSTAASAMEGSGAYPGMGIDRLATLRGAQDTTGLPALVIDGGSAITYTGLTSSQQIMGGGISPGVSMRMQALSDYTGALPLVDAEAVVRDLIKRVDKGMRAKDIFGRCTEDAIVVGMLHELSAHVRGVVEVWLSQVGDATNTNANTGNGKKRKATSNPTNKDGIRTNDERVVTLCGGAGNLIAKLLDEDNGGLIETRPNKRVVAKHCNGLIHFGISWVLRKKSSRDHEKPFIAKSGASSAKKAKVTAETYKSLVGKKIAKEFEIPDEDGENIYRGQILDYYLYDNDGGQVAYFHVVYADGDEEDIDYNEAKALIKKYKEVGPKQIDPKKNPESFIGKKVAKIFFETQVYIGTVKKYNDGFWMIIYEDGDAEEFDAKDLLAGLKLYEEQEEES